MLCVDVDVLVVDKLYFLAIPVIMVVVVVVAIIAAYPGACSGSQARW